MMPTALVHGFQRAFLVAAGFAVIGSLVANFVLREQKTAQTTLDREPKNEAESLPAAPEA